MPTVYVKQLPNLSQATRAAAYAKLAATCTHLQALGTDLLSIVVDPVLATVTVTLTNPVDDADQRQHLGLE